MGAWLRGRPEIFAAVLVAVAIAVVAGQRFGGGSATSADDVPTPGPSAAHTPTKADLRLRVERVGAALAEEPLYDDPESERTLDGAERRELLDRIGEFDHGVYVAIVPTPREDESGGDAKELIRRLQQRVGQDGVYVVADPYVGGIDVANYGTLLDSDYLEFDLPRRVLRPDPDAGVDDARLPERLGELLTLLEQAPRNSTPGEPPYRPSETDDDEEYEPEPLPSVFGADFGPGLAIGSVLALALFGLVVAACTPLRTRRRRRDAMWVPLPAQRPARPPGATQVAAPGARDFRAPRRKALHRAAQEALRSLAQRYTAATEDPGGTGKRGGGAGATGQGGPGALGPYGTDPVGQGGAGGPGAGGPYRPAPSGAVDPGHPGVVGPGHPGVVRAADCLDAALLAVDGQQDGRVDRDADPAALVCALVLARAGHAALDGAPHAVADYRCCQTNPLHGPEFPGPGSWSARGPAFGPATDPASAPLCSGCRLASVPLPGMRLHLPTPHGPVPYDSAPGPLAAAATGVTELIRQVREYAGVPH